MRESRIRAAKTLPARQREVSLQALAMSVVSMHIHPRRTVPLVDQAAAAAGGGASESFVLNTKRILDSV